MKTKVRNAIAAGLTTLIATQALATENNFSSPNQSRVCLNTDSQDISAIPITSPEDVRKMLIDLKENVGEEKLLNAMGRPALQSLSNYARLNKKEIYANAYLAAAAAGAAVSVVDYLWQKYVGSGGKDKIIPRDYFDKRDTLVNPSRQIDLRPNSGPESLTPVIGSAVAGAVAYRAVEYSLHKVFGDGKDARNRLTKPREFDLRENEYRRY